MFEIIVINAHQLLTFYRLERFDVAVGIFQSENCRQLVSSYWDTLRPLYVSMHQALCFQTLSNVNELDIHDSLSKMILWVKSFLTHRHVPTNMCLSNFLDSCSLYANFDKSLPCTIVFHLELNYLIHWLIVTECIYINKHSIAEWFYLYQSLSKQFVSFS